MSDSPRIRKKVYAEATATISFVTKGDWPSTKLIKNFLGRRGISLVGDVIVEPLGRSLRFRTTLTVRYRVHGGWRSDFVRKIEQDALDMRIDLQDLSVKVERREIPTECPRTECDPCRIAQEIQIVASGSGPEEAHARRGVTAFDSPPDVMPEPERKRRFLWR